METLSPKQRLCRQLRRWIVEMTTEAKAGHLTSSLSAVELMAVLFFSDRGFFRYDIENPEQTHNDRLLFSKGHASPLFYALWAIAGGIDSEELQSFRRFGSRLEGHPTREFPFTEVPTGSLGQGLGVGVGEALAISLQFTRQRTGAAVCSEQKKSPPHLEESVPSLGKGGAAGRVFVLLGDSELAEGSIWESAAIAAHYRLGNLVAIVDVNRLGQRGETMDGWDIAKISEKFRAFGWDAVEIDDGHNLDEIERTYATYLKPNRTKPIVFVAKTMKGKGISFLENKNGWHGKALSKEEAEKVLNGELKMKDEKSFFSLVKPSLQVGASLGGDDDAIQKSARIASSSKIRSHNDGEIYEYGEEVATRKVYGQALIAIAEEFPNIVALDAEVSNSTFVSEFQEAYPDRFFEMFIAEQNMVSCATGMARRGLLPFVSTFSAFFSRAFDQIRMAQYANVNLTFVGSHSGVSIGDDGASQMGLEDIAMFRSLLESVVLYPSDAISMMACVHLAASHTGISFIRTTRAETPIWYGDEESFVIGGSKTLRHSENDKATIIAAGITVSEAMRAYEMLQRENIAIRIVDAYSIKPIDVEMVLRSMRETDAIITVEDHYPEGGLGAAVREAMLSSGGTLRVSRDFRYQSLAVKKRPRSGQPEELLRYEEIDANAIVRAVKAIL
jgi:transketolase